MIATANSKYTREDSNPRRMAPEAIALSTELRMHALNESKIYYTGFTCKNQVFLSGFQDKFFDSFGYAAFIIVAFCHIIRL